MATSRLVRAIKFLFGFLLSSCYWPHCFIVTLCTCWLLFLLSIICCNSNESLLLLLLLLMMIMVGLFKLLLCLLYKML